MIATHFPHQDGHVSIGGMTTAQGVTLRYLEQTQPPLGESRERKESNQKDCAEKMQPHRRGEPAIERKFPPVSHARGNHGRVGIRRAGQEVLMNRP